MMIECSNCDEHVRKDTYITHIAKNHPGYFWEEVFTPFTNTETGEFGLRTTLKLKDAISVLDEGSSYELEDELFIDFAEKTGYTKSHTAMTHIRKHVTKHQENFLEVIKEGLTVPKMVQLLKYIVARPVKLIHDKQAVNEAIAKGLNDLEVKNVAFHKELAHAREEMEKIRVFKESDAYKDAVKLNHEMYKVSVETYELRNQISRLKNELSAYENCYSTSEARNQKTLSHEMEEISYWEKARKQLEAKVKKIEENCDNKVKGVREECDKKVKKAIEDLETAKEKAEKKERKLKDQVKAGQLELKLVTARAKAKYLDKGGEDSSDSDSD